MSIEENQGKLREALSRSARPYPKALRARAVRYAEGRRRKRVGVEHIAHELGIAAATLWSWLTPSTFREVEIVKAPIVATIAPRVREGMLAVIDSASGLRVEGLDLESVAALIRRLR